MFLATAAHLQAVKSTGYSYTTTDAKLLNVSGSVAKEDVVYPIFKVKILHEDGSIPEEFRWTQRLNSIYKQCGDHFTLLICQGSATTQNTLKSAIGGIKRSSEALKTSIRAAAVYDSEDGEMYFAYAVCMMPPDAEYIDARDKKRRLYG